MIDERIRKLVDALNMIPGVTTFSSCGGHAGKLQCSQERYPNWSINFNMDYGRMTSALKVLLKAEILWKHYDTDFTKKHGMIIRPWWNGGVDFEISGRDDPDQFAGWIEKVLQGEKLPDGY